MARKGLPKKYAKMGFKKGWAAYKRTKRSTARPKPKGRKTMAKGKSKKAYRYARGGGGRYKTIIDGILAGAGGALAEKYVGNIGHPAVTLGVGFFRNNNVLKTEGARELGAIAIQQFLGGGGVSGGGGFFE